MSAHLQLAPVLGGCAPSASSEHSICVVLADQHASMRRSLRLLLDGEEDIEVIAELRDVLTVLRDVQSLPPHVLVIDLGMPNRSNIAAIHSLRTQLSCTEMIVLTMEESPVLAQKALDAGAIGFVLKDTADTELPRAIRNAARGQEYLSPRIRARLAAWPSDSA